MKVLHTIEEMHRKFQTQGSHPVLVTCNDLNDWVCKHDRNPNSLLNELLASKFAQIWEIKTPEIALITVKKEHISEKFHLPYYLFEKECFGSRYLKNSKEIDLSMISLFNDTSFRRKLGNKNDFLKIALFDIWLANDDRNHNNFNMLLDADASNLNFFYAIDHVNIFNSNYLNHGISEMTENDSIINTELAKILFGKNKKLIEIVNNLVENLYLCSNECQKKLDEILDLAPESWGINKNEISNKISQHLFTEEWLKKCETNFRSFVQSFIVN